MLFLFLLFLFQSVYEITLDEHRAESAENIIGSFLTGNVVTPFSSVLAIFIKFIYSDVNSKLLQFELCCIFTSH